MINSFKKKNNKIIIGLFIITIVVCILEVSYAMYGKVINGNRNYKTIAGDIYMRYITGEEKSITMIPSDTYNENDYYEFTINGKNTSDKDIIYDITLNHGEDLASPKIRLDDRFLRFRLVTVSNNVETEVDTANFYNDIANKKLYVGTISTTNSYNVTYRLYVWVNGVIVGNVDQDYTVEQWSNVYANIKVDVTGNFVGREADDSIASKFINLSKSVSYIKNYTIDYINKITYTGYDTQDTYDINLNKKDVYYFTGEEAKTNGNVLFAGYCWQIIRTTDKGGLKFIYNGPAENNQCLTSRNSSGILKGINAKEEYVSNRATNVSNLTNFGTGYTYDLDAGTFTLTGTNELSGKTWSDNSSELIGTYACSDNSTTCSELWYIGHYQNATSASIGKYLIGTIASNSQIGTTYYNVYWDSPALVGYMYNKVYTYMSGAKTNSYYANSVKYENGSYILQDPQTTTYSFPSVGYKYVCDETTTTTCNKVRFYYYVSSSIYYVLLENGDTNPVFVMLNGKTQGETNDANINVYNSSIKGYLDNWYKKNIDPLNNRIKGLIDTTTVYCNDRSSTNMFGSWNKDASSNTMYLQFKQYSSNLDLNCVNETDRFTTEITNTKAKLTYPVGLLTEPERGLMGAKYATTGQYYWSISPDYFDYYYAGMRNVNISGDTNDRDTSIARGVRPVVTIIPSAEIEEGIGTYDNPYVIGEKVTR